MEYAPKASLNPSRPSPFPPYPSPCKRMFTYMLLGLVAGLLTGILIAWYRRQQ
jgi:hypothetical protein